MVMVLAEVQNANILTNSAYIFIFFVPFYFFHLIGWAKNGGVLTNVSDFDA